jgi:hypothetical protein
MYFSEQDSYVGDLINGKRSGKGELTYISGTHYIGDFKNNVFEGLGILTFPGDFIYKGSFHCGFPHGYGEKIYYLTSRCYKGFFSCGKYKGKAEIIEPNVYTFTGCCVADEKPNWSGGEMTHKRMRLTIDPLDSQLCGFGCVVFDEGKTYRGGLLNGWFHGFGVLKVTTKFKRRKVIGRFERGMLVGCYTICFPYGYKSWAERRFGQEFMCDNQNLPFFPGSYEDDIDLTCSEHVVP